MSHGLQIGASYTFSKALGTASSDGAAVSAYFPMRSYNYGPLNFNRTQMMSVNYLYDVPGLGKKFGIRQLGWVTDNWQLSGVTTFQTGAPFTPGFATTNSQNTTGSTDGARIQVVSNPYDNIPKGLYFNPAAFVVPAIHTFGNAGANILYGPGFANWDLSATKRFKFREGRSLAFRLEGFNVWNHTNFNGVYTTANFNPTLGTQTDPTFGMPSSARNGRNVQLSARLTF
jgi:hypothetical protein